MVITVDDGESINVNVTCSRWMEGGTLNVLCPPNRDCLTITCPLIDIMCGVSQSPFGCFYGHWSDSERECRCDPGYKGRECLDRDLGVEALQLFSASDPILITYYNTFCLYGLQWGDPAVSEHINGVWRIRGIPMNASDAAQYNPVYIAESDSSFIMYYRHCDRSWFIADTLNDRVIGQCLHDRFQWTDYGEVVSCGHGGSWYIDHDLNGRFLRDINIKMSAGDDTASCQLRKESVDDFVNYQYICIHTEHGQRTYRYKDVYFGRTMRRRLVSDAAIVALFGANG